MPADLAYGALLQALGDDAEAIAKDLEVYAGPEPPRGYTLEHEIDGVTRQPVAGNREPRHTFALEDFEAHANGAREDNIRCNSISEAQCQNPGEPAVRKFEDHEYDQPNAEYAQPENQQALQ